MSETIPDDVRRAAERAATFDHDPGFNEVRDAIVSAIMAERERAAKIANEWDGDIAKAIRNAT